MRPLRVAVGVAFYGVLVALIAAILLQVLDEVLPLRLARRVGHNSEGLVLALMLAAWIQFARRRLAGSKRQLPVTLAVSLGCLATGVALLATDPPDRLQTLNETFLAAAVIVPYLQLRRPLPRWQPVTISGGILAITTVGSGTELITGLAETLGVLVLLPLAFDVFDREILYPPARTPPGLRYGWQVSLVVVPVTFSVLERAVDGDGPFGDFTRFGVRLHEAFICTLLLELYLGVAARIGFIGGASFEGRSEDLPSRDARVHPGICG